MSDDERRGRLAVRHALAPSARVATVEAAVEAMTCLHATEPANVYLSAHARSGATRDDIERALFDDRTVVRQLAMRRTVFAFPRDLLPAVWGSASARVAAQLGRRLAKEVEAAGVARGRAGLAPGGVRRGAGRAGDGARRPRRAARTDPDARRTPADGAGQELRRRVPGRPARALDPRRRPGSCSAASNDGGWKTHAPVLDPRLGVAGGGGRRAGRAGRLRRARGGAGCARSDRAPRPTWSGGSARPRARSAARSPTSRRSRWRSPAAPRLAAARRRRRGGRPRSPGRRCCRRSTRPRWAGSSATSTSGSTPRPDLRQQRQRRPHAWWNGRIVGGWTQEPDGTVVPSRRRRCRAGHGAPLEAEAARLTAWLDGDVVRSIYQSPLARAHPS